MLEVTTARWCTKHISVERTTPRIALTACTRDSRESTRKSRWRSAAPSAVARRRSGWGSALSAVSALALSLRSAAPRRRNLPATASCVCDTTRDALQPRPHRCINWRPHVAKTQTPRPQARMVHYPRLVPASTAPRAWSFEAHVTRQGGGRLRDQRRPSPSRPHRRPRVQH